MKNHDNRPGAIFYTLNRRHRVLHRLGYYVVQRREPDHNGHGRWVQINNATANRDRAVQLCAGWGEGVRYYHTVQRWL